MKRRQKDLEDTLSMAELRLACMLVDHRDHPDMQRILTRQRAALLVIRRRVDEEAARRRSLGVRLISCVKSLAARLVRAVAPRAARPARGIPAFPFRKKFVWGLERVSFSRNRAEAESR